MRSVGAQHLEAGAVLLLVDVALREPLGERLSRRCERPAAAPVAVAVVRSRSGPQPHGAKRRPAKAKIEDEDERSRKRDQEEEQPKPRRTQGPQGRAQRLARASDVSMMCSNRVRRSGVNRR